MNHAGIFVALLSLSPSVPLSAAQSPRAANPERPTVATHAYAVAPGYAELEQGLSARGVGSLREATSWDLNLKIGIAERVQLGLFGPGYARTGAGTGLGDVGLAVKLRTDLSSSSALALVPGVSFPTGDEALGLGAGRVLGSLVGVLSADLSWAGGLHVDFNAGPVALGAGVPQWFSSAGASKSVGRAGLAVELFDFTSGGAGPRQRGLLGALLVTFAEWGVADVGGVWGLTVESPDQLFVGLTTNLGRIFK